METLTSQMFQVFRIMDDCFPLLPVVNGRIPAKFNLFSEGIYFPFIFHIKGQRGFLIEKKEQHNQSPDDNQREMRLSSDPEIEFFKLLAQ